MRLYYIVQSEILAGGVVEAQVVAALRAHAELVGQPKTKLVFLEPARVALRGPARATIKRFRDMWPEGDIVIVPFVGRMGRFAPGMALVVCLARELFSRDCIVFHCRGPAATESAVYARQVLGKGRIVFDLRGAGPYESTHRLGFREPVGLSQVAEGAYSRALEADRSAARAADAVFAVSPGLCDYAESMLDVSPDRVSLVPSCVGALSYDPKRRHRLRAEWGISEDDIVFAYSGRLGRERLPEQMFQLFASVRTLRPSAKFLLATYLNEYDDIKRALANAGIPESAVLMCAMDRDQVVDSLCAADVGLMLLESARRYRYCFPIKVPEYLGAGLGLVVNKTCEQIPELVVSRGIGWVVGEDEEIEVSREHARRIINDLESEHTAIRHRALAVCDELFLWGRHIEKIRHGYGSGHVAHTQDRAVVI